VAALNVGAARLCSALAAALALLTSATAQVPPPPAQLQQQQQQQIQQQSPLGSANQYEPGPFGQPRPTIGANPYPLIRRPTDCPLGYIAPKDKQRIAHMVVCVVKPQNLLALSNVAGPGAPVGQQVSSLPPMLERTAVNQCAGRPAGSYACGRGGSECCSPKQDNMCFAGAYACYADGTGTGPKSACCISK
jgi:hypothetical protein